MPDIHSEATTTTSAPPRDGASIDLINVTKRFSTDDQPAVDGISLHIEAGEMVALVGPSGCGKTTTLKMINRLIEPTSGQIVMNGDDVTAMNPDRLRRRIGYVIQAGGLFPHNDVATNIALVPRMLRWDKDRITARVDELLELVGLDPDQYRGRFPRELSGGQQQRIGVARALAADPPVLLMDEPFGAVDPITRQRLQDELLSIHDEIGKTMVIVTHDIDEAIKLGDRIAILDVGARVAQFDTPEAILTAPAEEFVSRFIGDGAALKSLRLARVATLDLRPGLTARVGEPGPEVAARARAAGERQVAILDDRERPLRWPTPAELDLEERITADADPGLPRLSQRSSLAKALDLMLTASQNGAIVTGMRDRYEGYVTAQDVMAFMSPTREDA